MPMVPGVKQKAAKGDAKRQPGAYISRDGRHLYRVVGPSGTGMLRVENAMTGNEMDLTAIEVAAAKLERPAPRLVIPDHMPDHTSNHSPNLAA